MSNDQILSDKTLAAFSIIALIELRESIDSYIAARIEHDKTIEGILKDIQSSAASIAENGIVIDKRER